MGWGDEEQNWDNKNDPQDLSETLTWWEQYLRSDRRDDEVVKRCGGQCWLEPGQAERADAAG